MEPEPLAYLRKSRDPAELRDPDILSKHRNELQRLAAHDGRPLAAPNVYEEIGSGEHIASRPRFQAALAVLAEQAERGRRGGLMYVMDVDRLSRGQMVERAYVLQSLAAAGRRVRIPGNIIDLEDPDQRLLYQVKGDLAENELAKYKVRVKRAWDEMLRNGQVRSGHVPQIGYRWSKDHGVIVIPAEFEMLQCLLRDAFSLSIERLALKYGRNENQVCQIIRNPFVCGWPARRWRAAGRGSKRLPREQWEWPERAGDYPAAMEREEWERLQLAIDGRRLNRDSYRSDAGWCRDIVRFLGGPDRGAVLAVHSYPGYRVETYELIPPGQKRLYVPRETVHSAAEAEMRRILTEPAVLDFVERLPDVYERAKKRSSSSAAAVQRDLTVLRGQMDSLLQRELAATDGEEVASIARVRAQVKATIARKRAELEAAQAESPDLPALEIAAGMPMLLANWTECWGSLPARTKRLAVNAFLLGVLVEINEVPGQRRRRREVVEIERRSWLERLIGN